MTEQQMNDIGIAILSMSQDEMNDIIGMIEFRRQQIQERAKAKFSVGDFVWWIDPKSKEKYNGQITKINRKYIQVDIGANTTWRVPPAMLNMGE